MFTNSFDYSPFGTTSQNPMIREMYPSQEIHPGNKCSETLELIIIASYLGKKEKLPYVIRASTKLDLLKFFLQVAWEIKALDSKKYIMLSEGLDEIGRMLGGWHKHIIEKENPA